ncbi:hypothetical protein EF912_12290 [Streptomyces sp. WAC07061]|uniref:hypothetical protein n=1 Tax=Streptomyces sp. WAC07061 TaxID=2487410 RepID=UPI000F7AEC0C|nr:hypothetical protein [Streptomyces sp. WAC07061]RSS57979.1 hypothetical protein EF912_12290 [Streptomyces sp. WAC07061]
MKKNQLGGRTRIASLAAGFAVAAGLTFSGPFIHPPAQDQLTASGQAADRARCFLSVVELDDLDITKCAPKVKLPVDRRETFDWI